MKKMTKSIFTLMSVLLTLTLLSITSVPCFAEDSTYWKESKARTALWDILSDIEINGANNQNTLKLSAFTRKHPRAQGTDEALLKLANIYIDEKKFDKAASPLGKIIRNFKDSELRDEAYYLKGYAEYMLGSAAKAEKSLGHVLTSATARTTLKVQANTLLEGITGSGNSTLSIGKEVSIGAILPTKGSYSRFGEEALRGILLATKTFGKDAPMGKGATVFVEAFNPSDKGLGKTVDNLLRKGNVEGIIGPLLGRTAPIIAKRAQSRRIPIITLTQKQDIQKTGNYVFRNSISPGRQAAKLAMHATEVMGLKRFAILYPENRYGKELATLFAKEVTQRGGEIISELSYPEKQSDFAKELKKLFGIKVEERLEGRRQIREYTTTNEIEALYIPDYYDSIGQIAPYIAYYNIEDLQLLGSNGWNSPRLLKFAGSHVNGAIFVDSFFPGSDRAETKAFVENFKKTYGYTPGTIEAEAYDAAMTLLTSIRKASSPANRRSVRDTIAKGTGFDGATGVITFDPDGDTNKELFVLTVKGRRIKEVKSEPLNENTGKEETQ
jgi:ABC-type branched-subunit amino acid transport system substrate-binding protein